MATDGAAEFQPSSPRATDENGAASSCSICYSAIVAEDVLWSCARCRSPCHLRCTLQWVLRTVMNADGATQEFTCPVCRTPHAVSSLPGFENTTTRGTSRAPGAGTSLQSTAALLNVITSIFPEMASVSVGPSRQRTITFIPAALTTSTATGTRTAAARHAGQGQPRRRSSTVRTPTATEEDDDDEDEEDDDEEEEEEEYEEMVTAMCNIHTRNVSISIDTLTIHYHSNSNSSAFSETEIETEPEP